MAANDPLTTSAEPAEKVDFVNYTWKIRNWAQACRAKLYSDEFYTEKHKWRMMIIPKPADSSLALYMDCLGAKDGQPGWSANVNFLLCATSTKGNGTQREATHKFVLGEADWGFASFMKLRDLNDPAMGYVVDDTVTIEATVQLVEEEPTIDFMNYDSRKETGYIGLKNQGATCYMNSLLQALFHVTDFRKSVYAMPTEQDDPEKSIPLALQRLFYKLQYAPRAVGTKELTKSFGWDSMEAFYQHDVQELNRVLMDNMENKMKKTAAEGTVNKLFEGKVAYYVRCINVPCVSERSELFYDISLNVKGLKNLHESFDAYTQEELLDGENRYNAEGFGLQDAKRGARFEVFPPVLFIHLKRFEFDYTRDAQVKINDKYEFPVDLSLDRYLKEGVVPSVPQEYELHAVLVHSGDVHGGHYYAFIRPTTKPDWFKFDDDHVTKATARQAMQDNYGVDEKDKAIKTGPNWRVKMTSKYTNAYMLLYVRKADVGWAMTPVVDSMVPDHLRQRFDEEQAEKDAKKKEKAEEHLYVKIKVGVDADFQRHDDFDLINWDSVEAIKVKKTATFAEFKLMVSEKFNVPMPRMRIWSWIHRQNKTCRPDQPVPASKEGMNIQTFSRGQEMRFSVEISPVPFNDDPRTVYFPPLDPNEICLYFKFYDPVKQKLRFMGRHFCPKSRKLPDLIPIFNGLIEQPPASPLLVHEEVKPGMIEEVPSLKTLQECDLGNGDILCFQHPIPPGVVYTYPTAREFFKYLQERIVVHFRDFNKPKDEAHQLEVMKSWVYDDVAAKVGETIGVDGRLLRFHSYSTYTKGPRAPLKRTNTLGQPTRVQEMLANPMAYYQPLPLMDILFFEVLPIPLAEFETKTKFDVHFYNGKAERVSSHAVMVNKKGTVAEIIEATRELVNAGREVPITGRLRLLEISNHKVVRVHRPTDLVSYVSEYMYTRIEEVPADEAEEEGDRTLQCARFQTDVFHTFGNPFLILAKKGETFGALKARIKAKLQVEDEEFATWKFFFVSLNKPEPLEDDTIVLRRDFWASDFIGIQYVDKTPPSQREKEGNRWHREERAIKIYN